MQCTQYELNNCMLYSLLEVLNDSIINYVIKINNTSIVPVFMLQWPFLFNRLNVWTIIHHFNGYVLNFTFHQCIDYAWTLVFSGVMIMFEL